MTSNRHSTYQILPHRILDVHVQFFLCGNCLKYGKNTEQHKLHLIEYYSHWERKNEILALNKITEILLFLCLCVYVKRQCTLERKFQMKLILFSIFVLQYNIYRKLSGNSLRSDKLLQMSNFIQSNNNIYRLESP